MNTIMLKIIHKSFPEETQSVSIINPAIIPRKGERVDMGLSLASTVTDILWQYSNTETKVTVLVD